MRFSTIFKAVQLSGFFWSQRFVPYKRTWCGYGATLGSRASLRSIAWRFGDGIWARGFVKHRRQPAGATQDIGFFLLQFSTPFLAVTFPWAWKLLLNLKVRSYLSSRLKTSLPGHGQRTRSNHKSARQNRDPAAQLLRTEDWGAISGFLSGRGGRFVKKKAKSSNKATSKSAKDRKKPAVRTSKKPNVWR